MKKILMTIICATVASTSIAYYNSQQGRWLNRDPIGENGGQNLYVILYNDSINAIDLFGLYSAYSGNPHSGQIASSKEIDDARAELRAVIQRLQTDTHDSTGVKCFDVQILDDPNGGKYSFGDITDAPNADYSFITAHGSEAKFIESGAHVRMFWDYSGSSIFPEKKYMGDSSFESLANRYGNVCTVYGCYSERDNPNGKADLASQVLLHMKEDLDALKCTDDACETVTVTIVFAHMGD